MSPNMTLCQEAFDVSGYSEQNRASNAVDKGGFLWYVISEPHGGAQRLRIRQERIPLEPELDNTSVGSGEKPGTFR